jgi:hypothetical protein
MPQHLRRLVIERARECCEYCLVSQLTDSGAYHIDHLTALKHGGQTVSENLALACVDCNLHKGSDLATIDRASGAVMPLFNPRQHDWREHFRLAGAQIVGITAIGHASVRLLRLSVAERLTMSTVLKSMHGGHTLLECASHAGAFTVCCQAGGAARLCPPKAGARLPHSTATHRTAHRRPLPKRE